MKILSLILALVCSAFSYGQTGTNTSNRLIGISSNGDVTFFKDDDTDLSSVSTTAASGHGIFYNPADSLIYGLLDFGGDRNLYRINPFTGATTLIYDFNDPFMHTADIANNNKVYAVIGNGSGDAQDVMELDMNTLIETLIYTTGASSSRAIEFNPVDSSLYVYEGWSNLCYVYDLGSGTETSNTTSGMNDELHGAFYNEEDDLFLTSAYGGEMYETTSGSYFTGTLFHTSTHTAIMDLTEFPIIRAESDTVEFCSDSTMLSVIYSGTNFDWYKDGVLIPNANNDSIWVSADGEYQALVEIGTSGNHVWSRPIVVQSEAHVSITSSTNDVWLCPNNPLTLTGATTGTLQWLLNGVAIPGATGPTYVPSVAGAYNQQRTVPSGCTDTASTPFNVILATIPVVNITQANMDTVLCQGESIVLNGVNGLYLQWTLNGFWIPIANSPNYTATQPGAYNLIKTNVSGCSDTASHPYIIYELDGPEVDISQAFNDSILCPGRNVCTNCIYGSRKY